MCLLDVLNAFVNVGSCSILLWLLPTLSFSWALFHLFHAFVYQMNRLAFIIGSKHLLLLCVFTALPRSFDYLQWQIVRKHTLIASKPSQYDVIGKLIIAQQ